MPNPLTTLLRLSRDPDIQRELMLLSTSEKATLARMVKRLLDKWKRK